MKNAQISDKASSLLWKYRHTLKEVVAQKDNYNSQSEYMAAMLKYSSRVNYLQGVILRNAK
jgi:hypothetical protein